MNFKVNKSNLFHHYLLWLDPMLSLTKVERGILASLLTLHFTHKDSIVEPKLSELITEKDTLDTIRKKLRLGKKLFEEGISKLKQKGYLTENGIASMFTNYPDKNKFIITIELEIT